MESKSYIYDEYKKHKRNAFGGKLIDNDILYLECGMEMEMCLKRSENGPMELIKQVTVREIFVEHEFQKKGLFTEFVRRILEEKKIAICLESVQPDWLKKKLEKSKFWVLQTSKETKKFNPNYARFPAESSSEENKEFSLF